MGKVKAQISVSLDGYIAGPNQGEEQPLGEGGMDLHEWVFKLSSWQRAHGREQGEGDENPSNAVMDRVQENTGAVVMGRNMFGPVRGAWGDSPEWNGWWGEEPPFHCPTFVLTHHGREPLELGETTFYFVTEGIESAIARAKEAAGDRDVSIGGGASTIQQAIASGLLDEIWIHQVPILLGGGESLLAGLPAGAASFKLAEVVQGPDALHLRYKLG